ncbi:uncharacterized protein [Littorina saxatilis]|uniref:uncharacterized protein n=1 Tax=Littorina saxatilis TaxID=31220 RepID=UPI0038B57D0C
MAPTDSKATTATVATCTAIITAVIVTIAWIVVYRCKTKVTFRRRLAPQHDLALQEIQDRNQQPPLPPPAQPQQQQQRLLPEIPGQYQVPCSVPASSGLDARRSVGRMSHVYEVVGGDQEGEVPEVLKTELPDTNLHPRPPAQEMTAAQASKPSIGNGLYFHIHPNE